MKTHRLLGLTLLTLVPAIFNEPLHAAIITGETATTTSFQANRTASDAVDNGGITVNSGDLTVDGGFEHDNVANNMWQTLNGAGSGEALGESITIDLNGGNGGLGNYNLDGMRIWNFNEGSGGTDTAISVYDLETSPNGTSWTLRQDNQSLAQAPGGGLTGYDGVYTGVSWNNTRFVRITVVDTYRGGDDIAGLAELMFSGTQLAAVPEPVIIGETATATSEQAAFGRFASDASDNSGITVNGANLAADGDFEHDNVAANMWQTENGLGGGAALGEQLTIDLNHGDGGLPLYNVNGMRIWNFNEGSGGTDTAISVYDLETSPDGSTWTLQQDNQSLAQAPGGGLSGYDGVFSIVDWDGIRFVRITVVDTYRGSDDVAGLAEVMFTGVPVPEPASAILLGVAGILLVRSGRRSARA